MFVQLLTLTQHGDLDCCRLSWVDHEVTEWLSHEWAGWMAFRFSVVGCTDSACPTRFVPEFEHNQYFCLDTSRAEGGR